MSPTALTAVIAANDMLMAYRAILDASIAGQLAGCVAGAGGVARLHADALREVMRAEPRDRAAWIIQESRMAFIGVLGYLANMYRGEHRR